MARYLHKTSPIRAKLKYVGLNFQENSNNFKNKLIIFLTAQN